MRGALNQHSYFAMTLIVLFNLISVSQAQDKSLKVFDPYHGTPSKRMVWMEYTDAHNALYHYFKDMGQEKLKTRVKKIAGIQSFSEWKILQNEVRTILHSITGPIPEKTPLRTRITGPSHTPYFLNHMEWNRNQKVPDIVSKIRRFC